MQPLNFRPRIAFDFYCVAKIIEAKKASDLVFRIFSNGIDRLKPSPLLDGLDETLKPAIMIIMAVLVINQSRDVFNKTIIIRTCRLFEREFVVTEHF